jgi:hypothetical protein
MSETIYMPRPHMALRLLYLAVVVSALPPAFVIAWCIMAWRFGCALPDDFVEMKHRML